MKLTDWVVRALVTTTFVVLLFGPKRWGFPVALICFAVVGIFALLYPQGALGWAKTAHPTLDVDDSSIWWVPRFIGGGFIVVVLLIALTFVWR